MINQILKESFSFSFKDWKMILSFSLIIWVLNYMLSQTIGGGQQSAGFVIFAIVASLVQIYFNVLFILKSEDHWRGKERALQDLMSESVWASVSFILYALQLIIIILFLGLIVGTIFYFIFSKIVQVQGPNYLLPLLSSIPTTFVLAFVVTPYFFVPWISVVESSSDQKYIKLAKIAIEGKRTPFALIFWILLLFFILGNFLEFVSMGPTGPETWFIEVLSSILIPVGIWWNYFFVGLYLKSSSQV
ncbi:MAG: hypothetical protein Fur0010_02720 [Bdellovibrio sp.]